MAQERFNSFNAHLRERFGCRVQRLSVNGDFTCPNRDGTKATGGCLFCDGGGSGAGYSAGPAPIAEQVRRGIEVLSKRVKGEQKYIVYFQSFTSTYSDPERLRALCEEALAADERVVGLALGARPDCLGEPMLDLLEDLHRKTYLWIDAGLESTNDATLARMNRHAYTAEFVDAARRAKARGLRICAHVIFGLPGDSPEDMLRSTDLINDLRLDGIKLHNLYIDSLSPFAPLWRAGKIPLMTRDEYVDLVCRSIARLRPETLVHRLTGEAPRARHLAPDWAANKIELLNAIRSEMDRREIRQGMMRI